MLRSVQNFIDSFRPVHAEVLLNYQHKMPSTLNVKIGKDGKQYYAEVSGLDNKDMLFTQARDRAELEEMVNDAVATYYEIPYRYARLLLISKRYVDPDLPQKTKAKYKTA